MRTLKTLFLITFIIGASLSVIAQESLFQDYLIAVNKADETNNYGIVKEFRSKLNKSQLEYLNLKMDYHNAIKNRDEDPCRDVRSKAVKSIYLTYETLLFTEKNDISFFSKCKLWHSLRYNSGSTAEEKLKALEILKGLALKGDAQIQYDLALEYGWYPSFKRMKLETDPDQYFKYMKMAAKQGYSDADYRLHEGYEHIKDYNNAVIWLKKAIANETEALNIGQYRWELASYYEKGKGVDKDMKKAFELYQMGADISAGAHYHWYSYEFGLMLYEGKGPFKQNKELGLKYIKSAAKSNTVYQAENYCKKNGIYY
ncbi:MAG: tetratricopeptide repeat protein [Flavobacteriaceae bacterium]